MPTSESGLSRRTLLQAAGASTLTAYAAFGTAGTASAADDHPVPDRVVTYPIPSGAPVNNSFSVKVRPPQGEWQPVGVYLATFKIINENTGSGQVKRSSMAFFDFSGTVEVAVTSSKGAFEKARIRPLSYGIEHTAEGDTLTFTLTEPRSVSIEIDGDVFDNLHLNANPVETNRPDLDDPDVIYYGPGLHTVSGNILEVPTGKTLYLEGGAVLKARVSFNGVTNARAVGRGVVWNAPAGSFGLLRASNIEINGLTSLSPQGHAVRIDECRQVTVSRLHAYSSATWGDGVDVFCSEDVLVDQCFLRNSDDCIALYTHRWDLYGDTRNIVVRDSVLWADVAHPYNVGTHGNPADPEVLENLVLSNVDILDHREPQMNFQGCISINPGDSNLVRNVRIQDVRVEDFRWGQLINMKVMHSRVFNTAPGRGIDGVYVNNLSYNGSGENMSLMVGYDAERGIKNVTFQNLEINGTVIADTMRKPRWYLTSDFVPMFVNEHVSNLRFLDAATPASSTKPEITSPDTAKATHRSAFNHLITASGIPSSFGADGLPDGLTVEEATGLISGRPKKPGAHTVVVFATNSVGTATQTLTLTVDNRWETAGTGGALRRPLRSVDR